MIAKKTGGVEEHQWTYVSDQLLEVKPDIPEVASEEIISFRYGAGVS
jgi:hypothetical protein